MRNYVVKRVEQNNRKKAFKVTYAKGVLDFPYAKLDLKPSHDNKIKKLYIDPEIGKHGFTYVLEDGQEDTVLLDQVLYYNQDPEILKQHMLHEMTVTAKECLKKSGLSIREIARRMNTSPTQLYRVIDPAYYDKTMDQVLKVLYVCGAKVDFVVK